MLLQAVGGQDNLLRVWCLKTAYPYFDDMRQKYSEGTQINTSDLLFNPFDVSHRCVFTLTS